MSFATALQTLRKHTGRRKGDGRCEKKGNRGGLRMERTKKKQKPLPSLEQQLKQTPLV